MKSITIEGQKFEYEIFYNSYGNYCWTIFYQGTYLRKKYILFGEKVPVPKEVFRVYENIESPTRSKDDIKKVLLQELKLIKRKAEIKRGEII